MITSRTVPYGNAACESGVSVIVESSARASGPHTPMVHSADDRFSNCTEPAAGRWRRNQTSSRAPSKTPVTMRNRSPASRWMVRSARMPPSGVSSGV